MSTKEETKKILYGLDAQKELEKALEEEKKSDNTTAFTSLNLTLRDGKVHKDEQERHAEICARLDTISTLLVKVLSALQSSSSSSSKSGEILKG